MVSTNQLKFIKYFLIVILSIGLYFTWLQKDKFEELFQKYKEKSAKFKEKTDQLKQKTDKLTQEIELLQQDLDKSKKTKTIICIEENKTKSEIIKIILPDTKIDYSKIIPKVDYKNIDLKLTNKNTQEDNIKITPNITLDEENKIDKIEVQIKTKF
ncbi:MAG: hypothetical protein KAJ49_06525 [Arcobacteraceae bacterium]|nr:hypothetical protein [Arcobacteraceae bacterium]